MLDDEMLQELELCGRVGSDERCIRYFRNGLVAQLVYEIQDLRRDHASSETEKRDG